MWNRLLPITLLSAAAMAQDSDVLQLTQKDFKDIVNPEKIMLVEFFAPWCGHCKALAPEYEKAATMLKDEAIKLAKVDCTEETELCGEFGVQGYPTLKVFREGDHKDYGGGRKTDLIVDYMKRQALPAVSILDSVNHDAFSTNAEVVVVAYLDKDDEASNTTFSSLANSLRDDFMFGASSDAAVIAAAGVKTPSVVLYKKFDDGKAVFDGELSSDALKTFIKTESIPLIGPIGPENFMSYQEAGLPLAYIFHETEPEAKTFADEFAAIAKEHKGKVSFVTIDATKFGGHASNLNLKQEWPAFAIQKPDDGSKFPFEQPKEISASSVKSFVEDFLAGKIEPSIKSEPIPETQDEPVYTLVAHNFDEIVFDKSKDVLVEFYAPWCGHCKKLKPIWDQLGEKYGAFKDKVVIAKMDATENDIPATAGFQVQGFPTIKFFPAGDNKTPAVDYEGDRSLESFIEFLDANTVNKVDLAAEESATIASAKVRESILEDMHDEL